MADATYDAIIIGGGNKGLVTGMYLQRYGGMDVAIFERRHELGGGWSSEESPAPGFIADHHATDIGEFYATVLLEDFPEIKERGLEWVPYYVAGGGVFTDDNDCYLLYSPHNDPEQQKTAQSLTRFSKRDAETWLKLWEVWTEVIMPSFMKYLHTPPPSSIDELDEMEKILFHPRVNQLGIDRSMVVRSPLEVLRDLFESEALIAGMLRISHSWTGNSADLNGAGLFTLFTLLGLMHFGGWKGGTHTAAHCTYKIFVEDGGKSFTEHEVDKVIIENGKAVGVRLTDGSEIMARKLVISTLDPYNLCFKLTGKEHWPWRVARRVENLERWRICITWYTWALHECPHYAEAAKINPDIDKVGWLTIGSKDPMALIKNHASRKLGRFDPDPNLVVCLHSYMDKTRVPDGKWSILTEDFVLSADQLTERQWRDYKEKHAKEVIELLGRVAPNMTWDNVIGYTPQTPFECARLVNMAPTGNWAVLDHIPSQLGRFRPIPELSRHKTPIENLYATGSGWHYGGGGFASQGYNCYKIVAEDMGLELPGEKAGREF